ncbi:MAG: enoyl-CoA hydratase-related protein [Bacteroidales bacterium]
MPSIYTEMKGPVAILWLNRPEVRNALNQEMIGLLTDTFESLNGQKEIRVIVLRGRGDGFCAGADLRYMQQLGDQSFEENVQDARRLAGLFESISSSSRPVVAYVHKYSMGGANGLVAASDIAIATEGTRFAFSETRVGLVPGVISPFVLRKAQHGAVRDWMLTGRSFTEKEALQAGLIQYIEPLSAPESLLNQVIQHLLEGSPTSIEQCKNLIDDMMILTDEPEQARRLSAEYIARARASSDGQEGLRAFLEKRKPAWYYSWKSQTDNP